MAGCFRVSVAAHVVQRGSVVPHILPAYHKMFTVFFLNSSVVSELRMSLQGNGVKLEAVAKRAELTY